MKTSLLMLLRLTGVLLLAAALLAGASAWQVYRAAHAVPPARADAAVILGAAAGGNKPSPVFRERIRHGIALYRNGTVKKLVFTGGTPQEGYPTEAEVGKRFALKEGVPEADVFTENSSSNTYENLKNTGLLMRRHRIASVIVVSDPYHLARARAVAADLGLTASFSATPTSRYTGSSQENSFFWREVLFLSLFRIWQAGKFLGLV